MANIPSGWGIIPGRGRDNAKAALAAADAAGVDQINVRTVDEGYLVPNAVLDEWQKATGFEVEPPHGDLTTGDEGNTEQSGEQGQTGDEQASSELDTEKTEGAATDGQTPAGDEGTEGDKPAESGDVETGTEAPAAVAPKGNASEEAWREFAKSDASEPVYDPAVDDELGRDELRAKFTLKS